MSHYDRTDPTDILSYLDSYQPKPPTQPQQPNAPSSPPGQPVDSNDDSHNVEAMDVVAVEQSDLNSNVTAAVVPPDAPAPPLSRDGNNRSPTMDSMNQVCAPVVRVIQGKRFSVYRQDKATVIPI